MHGSLVVGCSLTDGMTSVIRLAITRSGMKHVKLLIRHSFCGLRTVVLNTWNPATSLTLLF